MNQELRDLLVEIIAGQDFDMVISGSTDREQIAKVKVRPIRRKNEIVYQIEEYRGKQVFFAWLNLPMNSAVWFLIRTSCDSDFLQIFLQELKILFIVILV